MLAKYSRGALLALCLSLFAAPTNAHDDVVKADRKIEAFDLENVRLLPSPFKDAQDKNSEYLLSLAPDRLVAVLRANIGLTPKAPAYGGWEQMSIAGHSVGHYLSGLAKSYASTGDVRFKERAEYTIAELAACQESLGYGLFVGDKRFFEVFAEIKRGDVRTQGFDLNGLWVPWYMLHKIFAGALDVYRYCDCEQALEVAKKLGDWGIDEISDLTFDQMQKMLWCEYGGMNDSYYSLYAATGDKKYLEAGDRFHDLRVLQALSEGRDDLHNRHANTQVPKIIGLARRYEIAGNGELNAYSTADFFWRRVTGWHSYVIGGCSSGEHFGEPGVLSTRLTDVTCETCVTYNMLKLSQKLYMQTGDIAYMNYSERALYNHILASIDKSADSNSLYAYFIPLKQGGFRTYSDRENTWSCCHGTGMENHAQYNGEIYYRQTTSDGDILYVNLLVPSTLDWQDKGVVVTVDGDGVFTVDTENDATLDIRVRIPNNCYAEAASEKVQDGYYLLGSNWSKGKTSQELPFYANWTLEATPDNADVAAFLRGPIVYAGDVGSTNSELAERLDLDAPDAAVVPIVVTDDRNVAKLVDDATKAKRSFFVTPDSVTLTNALPKDVTLVPFYAAKERYNVYFDIFTRSTWAEKEKDYLAAKAKRIKLAAATLDYFQPGEMQPERDANFASERSRNGEHMGRKWRDAFDGGFFEFDMKVDPDKACALIVTYWGDDTYDRVFDVLVDGQKIAEYTLDRNAPGRFFDESYALPNPDKKSSLRIRFQAHPGKTAGGIFGARTIYEDAREELFGN